MVNTTATRRWGLALGWLATTALAVGLALAAVGAVSDSVTENRPKPLSAAAVSAALAEGSVPEAEPPGVTTGPPADPAPDTTTPTTTQRPPATARPTTTTRPSTSAPSTNTTATTAPVSSTSATTGPGGGGGGVSSAPEERTYELVGGAVRVRFADGRAELLSATPNAGFRVERDTGDPGEVRVTFRSDNHESRLRAWWAGGPKDQIDEKRR